MGFEPWSVKLDWPVLLKEAIVDLKALAQDVDTLFEQGHLRQAFKFGEGGSKWSFKLVDDRYPVEDWLSKENRRELLTTKLRLTNTESLVHIRFERKERAIKCTHRAWRYFQNVAAKVH